MNRKLESIMENAEDWESYVEAHGYTDNWRSVEWAAEIVRSLLAWDREETDDPLRYRVR